MKIRIWISRLVLLSLLVVPALIGFNCSGCSEKYLGARELANALADEFTGLLEFQDGVLEDGPPPDSDEDGPRLDALTAPLLAGAEESLPDGTVIGYDYEQWFEVLLHSPQTLEELSDVKGAIAFVQQANKDDTADRYIRIEPSGLLFEDDGFMRSATLFAQVHRLAELQQALTAALRADLQMRDVPEGMVATDGNAYHVYMALFARLPDGTEKVGNYIIWNLSTYPGDAGDNIIDMCVARSVFGNNQLRETNVDVLGDCEPHVLEAFGTRPSEPSPCGVWREFAAAHNTIWDEIVELAPDPDYAERLTVMYPVGTRFFSFTDPILHVPPGLPECWLELAWCPGDEPRCNTDSDCPTSDHICCDNLCRNSAISDNFCGTCDVRCGGSEDCLDSICGLVGCMQSSDCVLPGYICCDYECFDSLTDDLHCGTCSNPCTGGDTCVNGTCGQAQECVVDGDCPLPDDICCGNVCFDSLTDIDHCGDCITRCSGTETCVGGACNQQPECVVDGDCPLPDDICCGNVCFDSLTDMDHCGDCITRCTAGAEYCVGGVCSQQPECVIDDDCPNLGSICCDNICYDSLNDMDHCGDCVTRCTPGVEICSDGFCILQTQCGVDADCPGNADICCAGTCYDSMVDNDHCGNCTTQCIAPEMCIDGQCCPAGGCGGEIVIARWDFEPDVLGFPSLEAVEVAAHVIADPFTSMDGQPILLTSPGPVYWCGEDAWESVQNFMAILSTEPGWFMYITRIEFDQAAMAVGAGEPNAWQLTFMGAPGPVGTGPINTAFPNFVHESVGIPPDVHGPTFTEILWMASGAVNHNAIWGVDNVTIYGTVVNN